MPPKSEAQRQKDTDPAAAEFAAADKGGKLPAKVKDGKPVERGPRRRGDTQGHKRTPIA